MAKKSNGKRAAFPCLTVVFVYVLLCAEVIATPECNAGLFQIEKLVEEGLLSSARLLAFELLRGHRSCRHRISTTFVHSFEKALQSNAGYWKLLRDNLEFDSENRPIAKLDDGDCELLADLAIDPSKEWDRCCSMIPHDEEGTLDQVFDQSTIHPQDVCPSQNPCCEFFVGSTSHLRLPALYEPALNIRVRVGNQLHGKKSQERRLLLQQDGYLRLFDMSGILWPSGYLLSQCLANAEECGIPEVGRAMEGVRTDQDNRSSPLALELGSGIGAASIALALSLQEKPHQKGRVSVVSSDVAPQSLALSMANAHSNGVSIDAVALNHTDLESIDAFKAEYFPTEATSFEAEGGFSFIFGSSLPDLFQDSSNPMSMLWIVLDRLLDNRTPNSFAVLAHVKSNPLLPPVDSSFELVRTIDGDAFEMQTRSGDSSDFCLFVLRRRAVNILHSGEL